jgi:SulP family sulfate permease
MSRLRRLLPFLGWFPLSSETLRADLFAGSSVGLILIPQSMAYAQLAGVPAYYGLYAAFLPVLVGALWGSSRHLATGPVAIVSLLTGATLSQFAAPSSEQYVSLAILLALMVGVFELALGAFKLGTIINFLSHPVIVGFTNAAAVIIALSQLSSILGVAASRSESFAGDIWAVLQQVGDTHLPTLAMALGAMAIMLAMKKFLPAWPGVLVAVIVATALSWASGFERNEVAPIESIADAGIRTLASEVASGAARMAETVRQIAARTEELKRLENIPEENRHVLALGYEVDVMRLEIRDIERENRVRNRALRKFVFERLAGDAGASQFRLAGQSPRDAASDGRHWRIQRFSGDKLLLTGGGQVVGAIPQGIPALRVPRFNWDMLTTLLSTAFVITLVGFMEAVSMAKAMATRTRQRIDPNQELIGQGLANIAGGFSQAFPVSGSFSRSAVNLSSGAITGMSSVFTWLLVVATLLFLTPLLHHLPQAVLAAIILMAVINLINFGAFRHAWQVHRHDGIAAIATFVATLVFAPHLDVGVLAGAGLAIVLYLYRTMTPRVAILSRHPDGTLRDAELHGLPQSEYIIALRFDGQLYFANVPYFEDALLEAVAARPRAKHLLVVGDGINQIDASGEEVIRHLVQRLRDSGVAVVFSGLKLQAMQVMRNTGLADLIGEGNFFRTEELAIAALFERIADPGFDPASCPLRAIGT